MQKSGIYLITNNKNGVVYVGSAIDLRRRFSEHRKHLRAGCHKNGYLQNAWRKYGEAAFEFSVLLHCVPESLISEEQKAIDSYTNAGPVYNINPIAGSRLGAKVSEESRRKMGDLLRGKPGRHRTPHSEETKAKLRARVVSDETKAKMSAAKLGKKRAPFTLDTLSKMSKAQTGHLVSDRLRAKWSEERKGVPWNAARRAAYEANIQRSKNVQ